MTKMTNEDQVFEILKKAADLNGSKTFADTCIVLFDNGGEVVAGHVGNFRKLSKLITGFLSSSPDFIPCFYHALYNAIDDLGLDTEEIEKAVDLELFPITNIDELKKIVDNHQEWHNDAYTLSEIKEILSQKIKILDMGKTNEKGVFKSTLKVPVLKSRDDLVYVFTARAETAKSLEVGETADATLSLKYEYIES